MHRKRKVLIIDNEAEIAGWLKKMLEKEGYSADLSTDGLEGLQKAKKEKPDLVILELTLPGLDGYRVSAFIKRHKNLKETKILAISSSVTPDAQNLMEEAGIDLFMQKEKDKQKFLEKLALLYPQGSLTA